jgi:hypothetical protein
VDTAEAALLPVSLSSLAAAARRGDETLAGDFVAAMKLCWGFLSLAVFRLERQTPRRLFSAWRLTAGES